MRRITWSLWLCGCCFSPLSPFSTFPPSLPFFFFFFPPLSRGVLLEPWVSSVPRCYFGGVSFTLLYYGVRFYVYKLVVTYKSMLVCSCLVGFPSSVRGLPLICWIGSTSCTGQSSASVQFWDCAHSFSKLIIIAIGVQLLVSKRQWVWISLQLDLKQRVADQVLTHCPSWQTNSGSPICCTILLE